MPVVMSGGRAQSVTTNQTTSDPTKQARELQEALAGNFLSDPQHVMEDVAWQSLTQDPYAYQSGLDFAPQARQLQVQRARYTWRTFPLAKQGIRLFTQFVLGQGVAFHAEDPAVQKLLQEFWTDPLNRRGFSSMVAQKRALIRRQVDGELFLFLFTDSETGQVRVRVGEPLEINEVITDSDDAERPLYYERRYQPREYQYSGAPGAGGSYVPAGGSTGTARVLYYADAFNSDLPMPPPSLEEARVLHAKINDLGARGVSDLYAALDWLTSHQTFMQDRATLTHALAKVAWTKKVTGGPSAVAASAALERSTLSSLGATPYLGYEANPPAITGSTFVSNDGVTLAPVKVDTAAGNAETDGRMLTIQVGAALGIMIHYFGDGGDANLATATAMNEPMRQLFLDGQEGWGDLLTSLFTFVILQAIKAGTLDGTVDDRDGVEVPLIGGAPPVVTVEFPPIVREEVFPTVQALDLARKDGMISEEFAARKALNVLGADDIDDEVKKAVSDGPLVPPAPPMMPGQGPPEGGPPHGRPA